MHHTQHKCPQLEELAQIEFAALKETENKPYDMGYCQNQCPDKATCKHYQLIVVPYIKREGEKQCQPYT